MSRFIQLDLGELSLEQVEQALTRLGLAFERPARRTPLDGGLECIGDPVDIRLPSGTLDAVQEFGFVQTETGTLTLVASDVDEPHLRTHLLPKLAQTHALTTLQAALDSTTVEHALDPDGTHRLIVEIEE